MTKKNDKALFDLIDTIYLCGSGNADWQAFLDEYGRLFPSLKSALTGYDRQFSDVTVFCTSNYDPDLMRAYEAHYYKLNPWREVLMRSPMIPEVSWGSEVPLSQLAKTEFYADWIRPQENVVRGFTTMLFNEPDRFVNLTSNVNPRHIGEARRAAQSLTVIGPHLQRAFELSRQLAGLRIRDESMQAALDALTASIFVVDATGRVRFANARAECLLSRNLIVRTEPGSRLRFLHPDDQRAVMEGICRAKSHADHNGPRVIALRGSTKRRYLAFVSPLIMQRRELTSRNPPHPTPSNPVGVFIIDSSEVPQAAISHIAAALEVTPAEARLALALLHDKTLKDYADERRISINTARIQMRSLLDKTGTHRQARLVNLLAKLFTTLQAA